MTGRRYIQAHIRSRRTRPGDSTIAGLQERYYQLGDDVKDLEFQIAIMPDGLEKIRAMLVACDLYIRRLELTTTIDYRLARLGRTW